MRRLRGGALLCAAVAATVLAASAAGGGRQGGTIIADLGFKPQPDGFSFENYSDSQNDLTSQSMQLLYGAAVCATGTGANCKLSPQAQQWMDAQNKDMSGPNGGHCYGFSVSALLLYAKREQPGTYGAATTNALQRGPKVENFIAYTFVHQMLDSVRNGAVSGTPNQIVDALIQSFKTKNELYTIAIEKRGNPKDGHAITPFAIQRNGNTDAILVYDNNYPNETRQVLVDRAANTWKYEASINPQARTDLYEGDAQTQSLSLYPTFPGLGVQPCPFCGAAAAGNRLALGATATTAGSAAPTYDTYFLSNSTANGARLLLTDPKGRKLGWVGKRFMNQIPGARVIWPLMGVPVWARSPQPQLRIPAGRPMTITIDGTAVKKATTVRFTLVSRGRFISVRSVQVRPGQRATIRRNATATSFTYTSGKTQAGKPVFAVGFQGARGKPSRTLMVSTHGLKGGSTLGFTLDQSAGTLEIDATDDVSDLGYDLDMETIDEGGVTNQSADDLSLTDNESGTLNFDDWNSGDEEPPIDVQEDSGG